MDEKKLKRLHELASPEALTNTPESIPEGTLAKREFEIRVYWWQSEYPGWRVGWYSGRGMASLEEKLAELPPGSRLKLTVPPTVVDHTLEVSQLRKAAAEHNLVVEDAPSSIAQH